SSTPISLKSALKAWSPYILILLFLMGTSTLCPPVHDLIAGIKSSVVVYSGEGGATLSFSWVNTPGVMIFAAAVLGAFIQGASFSVLADVLLDTVRRYWRTVLTICCVMSMAKVMGYAGMISDIATVVVAVTGMFYPFVSPLIGALGAFVTGSGTSTNVLFGSLQAKTAAALGLNPSWLAAANVMGAGIGKMICPQGIAIGASAVGLVGSEREIMGRVGKYFAFYLVFAGLTCMGGVLLGL
ncbi:MAG: L-lactate permease, partial [Eggerthellaceae bacterium]|nr:L-lactate permease [Eggerthellaceae bacterium]